MRKLFLQSFLKGKIEKNISKSQKDFHIFFKNSELFWVKFVILVYIDPF